MSANSKTVACVITTGIVCTFVAVPAYCMLNAKRKRTNQAYDIRVTVDDTDLAEFTSLVRNKDLQHIPEDRPVDADVLAFMFVTEGGRLQITAKKNNIQVSIERAYFGNSKVIKQQITDKLIDVLVKVMHIDDEDVKASRAILPTLMMI